MVPKNIQAGITAQWREAIPSIYSDYSFQYILRGTSQITIPASVSGGDVEVNVAAADTAAWAAGDYYYQLIATKGSDKHIISSDAVIVDPDFTALADGHDFRSHAQKMLDAINQVLEGRIPKDVETYQIENRSITRIPILELHKLKRTYTAQVYKEKRKQAGKSSFQPRIVKARFSS